MTVSDVIPAADGRLRILWLSHLVPYPPKGGAFQRSYYLLRQAARAHRVQFVGLFQESYLPTGEDRREAYRELSRFCERVTMFPLRSATSEARKHWVAAMSAFQALPYEASWLHSSAMHAHLEKLCAREPFDLVHMDTIGLVPYARWCRALPLVLNHHNIESHLVDRQSRGESSALRRAFLRRESAKIMRLEQQWCPAAVVNLTVSRLDSERLRRMAPDATVREVENGVDVGYFTPGQSGRRELGGMVFAGLLNVHANRDAVRFLVHELWPRLAANNPARRLTILGRNPPPDVRSAARDARVHVPGWVPDVRPYIDEASIYLCPIRTGGGTRLKVLDALAMAKALVSTAVGVEGLSLVDGTHYLRAESPQDYVRQIERLERDPELRRRLGQAGRDFVERHFAWDVIGEKLERAYQVAVRERFAAQVA